MLSQLVSAFAVLSTFAAAAPSCSYITPAESSRVSKAFSDAKLFPDVIPVFEPKVKVSASYGSKAVDLGNEFTLAETLPEPKYSISAEKGFDPASTKYFLLYIDPDAPQPDAPALLQLLIDDFLHLAVQDIQPACIANQKPSVIRPYLALTPLSVPKHRYIFLIFRQPKNFQVPATTRATIFGLRLGEFIQQTGLVLVGGNFLVEGLASNLPS